MKEFFIDLIDFIKNRKKYWLVPIIITLFLIGFLTVFAGSTAIAPFIYTMF